jgi:hypothetical protein
MGALEALGALVKNDPETKAKWYDQRSRMCRRQAATSVEKQRRHYIPYRHARVLAVELHDGCSGEPRRGND